MRPAHLKTLLQQEFQSTEAGFHTPVMLWGAPGVGKSDLINQVGVDNTVCVVDIRLSQMEPSDLRGIPFRAGDTVEWAIPAMLPDETRDGKKGILFLDEITSAPPSVSAAAYQLILDRRLGQYRVPDGWAIFAAGNRQGDRGVTYAMPAPLANRFSHFEVDINLDDWVSWAFDKDIDDGLIAFLRFRPELLFSYDPQHNPVAFPSPRSWEFANRALNKFEPSSSILLDAIQACVGPAAGVECHAFLSTLDRLPDIDAILKGESTECPSEIDLQYAVATTLVGRSIKAKGTENASEIYGHILNYASGFQQKEMGVMLVSDMQRAIGDELFDVPEFSDWAEKIADIMIY